MIVELAESLKRQPKKFNKKIRKNLKEAKEKGVKNKGENCTIFEEVKEEILQ